MDTTGIEDINTLADLPKKEKTVYAEYKDPLYINTKKDTTLYIGAIIPVDTENIIFIIRKVYIDKKINRWDIMDLD